MTLPQPHPARAGLWLTGTVAGVREGSGDYSTFGLRTADSWDVTRVSVKKGSEISSELERALSTGAPVALQMSMPRVATSKSGGQYLSWFPLKVELLSLRGKNA